MIRRNANAVNDEFCHPHRPQAKKNPISLEVAPRLKGKEIFQKKYVAFKKT